MLDIITLLAFICGIILGLFMFLPYMKIKLRTETEKKDMEIKQECLRYEGLLSERDNYIHENKERLTSCEKELQDLRTKLEQEQKYRTAAEQKNEYIPELEGKFAMAEQKAEELRRENTFLREKQSELITRLENEQKVNEEKLELLEQAAETMSVAFKAMSAEALQKNNISFIEIAKSALEKYQTGARDDLTLRQKSIQEMVVPIKESLHKLDEQMREMEKERTGAYASLIQQVKSMSETQQHLEVETSGLVKALRTPTVRGRWGEIQLRRVVEIAGMIKHCDFIEQVTAVSKDEGVQRPDMIVKLPGNRNIVIDSKTPLKAYLDAVEENDQEKKKKLLIEHSRQVKNHINMLGGKSYWEQFQPSPEFAVLFLPGESFFSAALEHDPNLIEYGVGRRVIIATPTTLIALLKSIAYGWQQEQVTENARQVSALGRELYDRIRVFAGHFTDMRKGLEKTVDSYNRAAGSLESRVLVSARRFRDLGVPVSTQIDETGTIETAIRGTELENVRQGEAEAAVSAEAVIEENYPDN